MLVSFGRFAEIAEVSGIPIDALDYAARYGDHDDKLDLAKFYGRRDLPYQDFDWVKVRDAIETLSGWKARRAELTKLRREAVGRSVKYRVTTKTKKTIADTNLAIEEILKFGYEAFVDTVNGSLGSPRQSTAASRMIKMRRKSGASSRYTPKLQFKKFIKEARVANFNIFDNEISADELDFDHYDFRS